jgi:hypothetical protein
LYKVFSSLVVFSEGCRSEGLVICWHTSRRLPRRRKPHRAVATVVAVLPHVDAIVHLPMAVGTRPFVEELEELEVGVLVHHRRHHRSRAMKLEMRMEKSSKS